MLLFKAFCTVILALFLVLIMIFTVGCEALLRTDYEFWWGNSEIRSIEIVELVKRQSPCDEYRVICEIHDTEQFLEDFADVKCFSHFTDPLTPSEGDVGIKITYNNGDYEVICASAQAKCIKGVYNPERGRHSFDHAQFDELIEKYIAVESAGDASTDIAAAGALG